MFDVSGQLMGSNGGFGTFFAGTRFFKAWWKGRFGGFFSGPWLLNGELGAFFRVN